jgi:transcriptional regulator GlxA family with amidase domain
MTESAIHAMHGYIATRWTVVDAAHEVGMSRTSFAERFRGLVGPAPLEYLKHWRMTHHRAKVRSADMAA